MYARSKKAGREEKKRQLDYLIMRFIVVGGLAISKLDMQEWRDVWAVATPEYSPPSATTMEDVLISQEAKNIKKQSTQHLKAREDLTLTFDGNATRSQESVYTIHVTDPDRRVFLMEGKNASGVSHIAEYIHGELKKVSLMLSLYTQ